MPSLIQGELQEIFGTRLVRFADVLGCALKKAGLIVEEKIKMPEVLG